MHTFLTHKEKVQTCKRVTHIAKIKLKLLEVDDTVSHSVEIKVPVTDHIKAADHTVNWPVEIKGVHYPITVLVSVEDTTSGLPALGSHVVSTVPFGSHAIDLSQCGLDYVQAMALRSLHYGQL